FLFSSRSRHTRFSRDWSSDVCSSDLSLGVAAYSYSVHADHARGGAVGARAVHHSPRAGRIVVVDVTPIHVQLLGPAAGPRKLSFDRSPVTFGRAPESDIVIADTAVSRQHGELQFIDGAWHLTNLSVN